MKEMLAFLAKRILVCFDGRFRLIVIAILVGLLGGCASVLLNYGLRHAADWLATYRDHWYAVFFSALGAAGAVIVLRSVIRDSDGHGVPEVIYAISRRKGMLRLRASLSRLIACLLTIASGGSAGPEAPVVVTGASIGSNIARLFCLDARQRIIAVCCGTSAAIAAIFNAPVTGIIFTMEVILEDWTPVSVVPIAIASVVGTEVSRLLQGNQIPFEPRSFQVSGPDLAACVGLSLVAAVSAVLLVRCVRLMHSRVEKAPGTAWLHAAWGGLMVGIIGLSLPNALGEGYECVSSIIEGRYPAGFLLVGMGLLAKIAATSLTMGSGGSGGIFAPCLVIGSFTGLLFQRGLAAVFQDIPWAGEGYYSLLGMAGVLSAVLKAPMTGVFLIAEITGGYEVLVSVVLVSVLSSMLSQLVEPFSFYQHELIQRGALLRRRTDSHVLSELNVLDLLEQDCRVVRSDLPLRNFVEIVKQSHRNHFVVEDPKTGHFLGMIHLDDVRMYLFDTTLYDLIVIADIMDREGERVSPDQPLMDVMRQFEKTYSWNLPVVYNDRFLGLISKASLLDYYRKQLISEEK